MPGERGAIVNAGPAAWALEEHAQRLSRALWLPISESPAQYNYLLGWDVSCGKPAGELFIPYDSILIASDKRLQARLFAVHKVQTPETHLIDSADEVQAFVRARSDSRWVLKWPIGCAATGHRLLGPNETVPEEWPRPYIVQEFVVLERPEVFRLYCVAGETFGWNARRFPTGAKPSPWVAHAQGARYEDTGAIPLEAETEVKKALRATELIDSFGCVDLLKTANGRWLVLEVGTDGIYTHVDRDIGVNGIADEIDRRVATAFWSRIGEPPWGPDDWRPCGVWH